MGSHKLSHKDIMNAYKIPKSKASTFKNGPFVDYKPPRPTFVGSICMLFCMVFIPSFFWSIFTASIAFNTMIGCVYMTVALLVLRSNVEYIGWGPLPLGLWLFAIYIFLPLVIAVSHKHMSTN